MANKRISSLTSLGATPAVDDIIPITDISDTTGSAQGTTKKVTVANLVAAAPQGDLLASNNLSDVASASTARTNLGLGTASTQDVGTANGNLVQLDSTGLPAVDGSQLTNLPAGSLFNTIVSESTTARTLSDSDCGKVIDCSNGSAVTITIPSTVSSGFNCTVVQSGAGQVTIQAGASVTLNCYSSAKATAGQYAAINIIPYASNSYVLEGDLAASGGGGGGGSFTNTYSVDFDGSNQYMAVTGITLSTAKTVSFWIKLDSTATDDVLFGNSGGKYYPYMPNNQRVNISNASQVKILDLTASHALSANTWHHLVIVGDGTTAKLYKDGVYRATADDIAPGGTLTNIGGASLNGSRFLAGKLDEFSVFGSALSDTDGSALSIGDTAGGDVAALYNSGSPPDIGTNGLNLSPVHWWRMGDNDSGTGTTVTDQGGGSNDGALTNGPTFSTDVP